MNSKISAFLLFSLSFIGLGVGYIFTNSTQFKICVCSAEICNPACLNFYERLGDPIFYGMGGLAVVFLLLLFVPRAWEAWKRFAIWFVPLATLIFIFYPTYNSGDFISPPFETAFQWISGVYVVISLVVIAWTAFRSAGMKN